MVSMYGLLNRDKMYASESGEENHKSCGCCVGRESVEEVVKVIKVQSGDCNGGWSMIEIAWVSRCIIGAW